MVGRRLDNLKEGQKTPPRHLHAEVHIMREGGAYVFVARLGHLIIDHTSLSRRSGGGRLYSIGEVYSISCMAVVV